MITIKSHLATGGLLLATLLAAATAGAADLASTRAAIARSLDAQYAHIDALYKESINPTRLPGDQTAAKLAAERCEAWVTGDRRRRQDRRVAIYKKGPARDDSPH